MGGNGRVRSVYDHLKITLGTLVLWGVAAGIEEIYL